MVPTAAEGAGLFRGGWISAYDSHGCVVLMLLCFLLNCMRNCLCCWFEVWKCSCCAVWVAEPYYYYAGVEGGGSIDDDLQSVLIFENKIRVYEIISLHVTTETSHTCDKTAHRRFCAQTIWLPYKRILDVL